uniref:DNA polymerase nu n=1 Tax=Stegastes partitus TaxID=144197 RepID=A0A3B5AE77_9TELE
MFFCCWLREKQGFLNFHARFPFSRSFTEEIRPSFNLNILPDEEGPDEMLLPISEQPNSHKEEHTACHPVSSYLKICEETGNTSRTQREMVTIESWNIDMNELEDVVASGSRLKWKKPQFDPTKEATSGVEDGAVLCMLSESETINTGRLRLPLSDFVTGQGRSCDAHSRNLMRNIVGEKPMELTVDSEHEVVRTGRGCKDAALLNRKGSTNEMGQICILGTTKISTSEGNSSSSAVERIVDCDTEVEMLESEEEGNFEHRTDTCEIKEVQPPPGTKSKVIAVGHHTGSPKEIPVSLESGHHTLSYCQTKNLQAMGWTLTETAEIDHTEPGLLVQSDPTSLVLGANSAANLERIDLTEVRLEVESESSTRAGTDTNTGPEMETGHPPHETGMVLGMHTEPYALKQTQQIRQMKAEEHCNESAEKTSKQTAFCKPCKRQWAKCGTDPAKNGPKSFHGGANTSEALTQSQDGCLTASLTSEPRVKDFGQLNPDEKMKMLETTRQAKVLVLTMVYRDGTTQLDPEQKLTLPVCGLLVLMKSDLSCGTPEDSLGPNDSLVYLKLEHTPAWAQQQTHPSPEDMLLQVLTGSQLVVCYKAKDLLRSVLQVYRRELNWKRVAGCHIQDPQVSAWLLDPTDPSSCFQDLLNKHCRRPHTTPALGAQKVSQIISGLCWLYRLNMKLCSQLQLPDLVFRSCKSVMTCVVSAMESHRIHVDKEALKKTSDLLGTKMKQLEKEAHQAAGQIFLVTSSTQLRTVLFEKLRLHERCENKKLPKTINKQQQSTSEAALLLLQDLHPLPKIILEYRQVSHVYNRFVLLKNYISSTWHQTSAVTGRISAKHPNFQALPRQPLQITKKQYVQGKEEEVVTVHPRAMFIPHEGWTFLAADFCQVELRLLAHLSSDPELLRIFTSPQADVFTMLASQWWGVREDEVTSEDREHAKRIVYSVVYGAGRERLSGILGVSTEQARLFQDSFLQTYRDVQAFIQRTIQQSHKQGYVLSIMGRRRNLPNINSPDWSIRMQAERQAVNFVVQGSAADLCKMAMIRIFNLVSSSSSLSARLIAQLHDELLYEVEDSHLEQFAEVTVNNMYTCADTLTPYPFLSLSVCVCVCVSQVPLKVAVSSGKSWGSMSELNIPLTFPSP